MTQEVKQALQHVRQYYPQVTIVVFNTYGRWQYMDDNFNAPKFGEEIDSSILQKAADSLETFPIVFEI